MSDDTGGRRRSDGADGTDAGTRPLTAAGRRRRTAGAGSSGSAGTGRSVTTTAGKGVATPTRDAARARSSAGSPLTRLRRFLREVVAELRKVHWPTRRQIVVYTVVVLIFVAFMVTLVSLLDAAFAKAVFALFG